MVCVCVRARVCLRLHIGGHGPHATRSLARASLRSLYKAQRCPVSAAETFNVGEYRRRIAGTKDLTHDFFSSEDAAGALQREEFAAAAMVKSNHTCPSPAAPTEVILPCG